MVGHGIRPAPVEVEDLHRCAFHGLGAWLKGRCESWYSPGFRDPAVRVQRVYDRHGDTFRRGQCEPLVPTMREGLFANRFTTPRETIITVYNGGYSDVSGDLVSAITPDGEQVTNLLTGEPATVHRRGDAAVIQGSVAPWSVGMFQFSSR